MVRHREDTVIGSLWAVGMAAGILFIYKTPDYNEDLMIYLLGSILMVSPQDLWMIAGLDILVVIIGVLFYNQFLALCFDEEFARLRDVHVEFYYLLLLCLTVLTVLLLLLLVTVTVAVIVMVIALLTLPAVASDLTKRLGHMIALATLLTALFTTAGLAVNYGPDLQPMRQPSSSPG